MKKIIVCGDSFSSGIGLLDLKNELYGHKLAEEFNLELINLAKGSASHLVIFLQVKYAIEKWKDEIDLLCISSTSYARIDWFQHNYEHSNREIELTDVKYHNYAPYGENTYFKHLLIPDPISKDSSYKGNIFTETLSGIDQYLKSDKTSKIFSRLNDEPLERIKCINDYFCMVYDNNINRLNCIGLLTMAHNLAIKHNINHLILTPEVDACCNFINNNNLVEVNWWNLRDTYPDNLGTLHTSEKGHEIVANSIKEKVLKNNWILNESNN